MKKVIEYVLQDKKTMFCDKDNAREYRLISGQNCVPETAFKEFMATKILHGKNTGVFYKHYVQSFKPKENITPQQVHQMGLELSAYFKGFEVLVATHIDEDHWHSHLIVNSVNADTGLKIQFNEKSLRELRKFSDEICKFHGLDVLKPYEKNSPVAGINTREYRAAQKGESWKFKLMGAVDLAMKASPTKADFIANMEHMGYGVKWENRYKYITYTTPDGHKSRDNRLHDEKYLKKEMDKFYEFREIESPECAGKSVERISNQSAVLRNTAGSIGNAALDNDRNRETPSTNAREDFGTPNVEKLGRKNSASDNSRDETAFGGDEQLRKHTEKGVSRSDERPRIKTTKFDEQQIGKVRTKTPSEGQHAEKEKMAVDRDRSIDTDSINGAVVALEHLLAVKKPKKQETERNIPQKKKSRNHGMER